MYDVMLLICCRSSRFTPWHTGNERTNGTHSDPVLPLRIGKHDLSKSPKHGKHLKRETYKSEKIFKFSERLEEF